MVKIPTKNKKIIAFSVSSYDLGAYEKWCALIPKGMRSKQIVSYMKSDLAKQSARIREEEVARNA